MPVSDNQRVEKHSKRMFRGGGEDGKERRKPRHLTWSQALERSHLLIRAKTITRRRGSTLHQLCTLNISVLSAAARAGRPRCSPPAFSGGGNGFCSSKTDVQKRFPLKTIIFKTLHSRQTSPSANQESESSPPSQTSLKFWSFRKK